MGHPLASASKAPCSTQLSRVMRSDWRTLPSQAGRCQRSMSQFVSSQTRWITLPAARARSQHPSSQSSYRLFYRADHLLERLLLSCRPQSSLHLPRAAQLATPRRLLAHIEVCLVGKMRPARHLWPPRQAVIQEALPGTGRAFHRTPWDVCRRVSSLRVGAATTRSVRPSRS